MSQAMSLPLAELLKMKASKDIRMHIDKELDTRGLNCPLPILKAIKALAEMSSGQLLRVVSTDSGSTRDFMAFAKQLRPLVRSQSVQLMLAAPWGPHP